MTDYHIHLAALGIVLGIACYAAWCLRAADAERRRGMTQAERDAEDEDSNVW
jgi:hypothetical protein